jgi:valyl-tRNA synthetase
MPVTADTEGEYDIYICCDERSGADFEKLGFVQDPDVLDTWFSSALWQHSTLGWPEPEKHDNLLGHFYPTDVLSTAREIITLWVARMVITGLYNIGELPFSDVFIHPLIQDGQGRKMSKSLGNGVDPADIIEEYGADALRFTLAELTTETQDIRLPVKAKKLPDGRSINISEKFEKGQLCNKLWQPRPFLSSRTSPAMRRSRSIRNRSVWWIDGSSRGWLRVKRIRMLRWTNSDSVRPSGAPIDSCGMSIAVGTSR